MQDVCTRRWSFLEQEPDATALVTDRMQVVYLNAKARSLVPGAWWGRRCWEIFPVADRGCASRCPAIRAVRDSDEIRYCEETVYPDGSKAVTLGVAVIPLKGVSLDGERAVLVMRAKEPCIEARLFRRRLLEEASRLHERCLQCGHSFRPARITPRFRPCPG